MIFTVHTYEHSSSGCAAIITRAGAEIENFTWLNHFNTFGEAQIAARVWLMDSEKRIGHCDQEPEPLPYIPGNPSIRCKGIDVFGAWAR